MKSTMEVIQKTTGKKCPSSHQCQFQSRLHVTARLPIGGGEQRTERSEKLCKDSAQSVSDSCECVLRAAMADSRRPSYGLLFSFFVLLFYELILAGSHVEAMSTPRPLEGVTRSRQQDNFYFDPSPMDQEVIEGQETRLRCDVSNRKHIRFYWTVNDRPLQNTSRRFQEDSDLRILRVDRADDSGYFQCIATNMTTGVSLKSRSATLTIYWLEKSAEVQLVKPKSRSEIVPGVEVQFKCQIAGHSEPSNIEWYKNAARLSGRKLISGGKLRLMNASHHDNGVYSCRVENEAGSALSNKNFLLNIPANDSPLLDADTFVMSQLVRRRDTARLTCKYSNSVRTDWYFKDKLLRADAAGKLSIFSNGTLVIRDVQESEAGWYRCVGSDVNGQSQSFTSEVIIAYLEDFGPASFEPKLPAAGLPIIVAVNHKLDIRCLPPGGLPVPEIRWVEPGGGSVTEGAGRVKADSNGQLSISNAQQSDSGNYTCVASNLAGEMRRNVLVVVSVAPRIAQPPLSKKAEEGQVATFDCKYLGIRYPVTVVTWVKEDSPPLKPNSRVTMNERDGTLHISNVQLSDEGNYACVVNTTGHSPVVSTNAHLYVRKSLKFKPPPNNYVFELNFSPAVVHCRTEGAVAPEVRWRKERGEGDTSPAATQFPSHVTEVNGALTFDGIQWSDVGNYTCTATSEQGTINATISIDVAIKPKFKVRPQNTTVAEGSSVLLHCLTDGKPKPKVVWHDTFDKIITNNEHFKIHENGTLYIDEVYMMYSGKYTCIAGNSGGLALADVILTVSNTDLYAGGGSQLIVDSFNMMKTIVIAVCSAIAYLAIVIGLTVYCSIRLVRSKNQRKQHGDVPNGNGKVENGVVNEHTELMEKKDRDSSILKPFSDDARSHLSGGSSQPSSHSQSSRSKSSVDKLSFPRHQLQTLRMLGKGHYGDVFLAKAFGIVESEPESLVSFKALLSREEAHQFDFRRELEMFARLNHDSITRLLGISRETEPFFLIFEYLEWGDLKQYLLATRPDATVNQTKPPVPTLAQKVAICSQVALGMEHMANSRLVHRDLAARNVLLSSTLAVKIGCLSLCHDTYASEYYRFRQQLIPLRWLPHEAVFEDDYSMKSDVWSFGVFMYEVFSLGELPYRASSDEEILKLLKFGDMRLDMPVGCPPEIYQLMVDCTKDSASERPSFSEIALTIGDLLVDSSF